MHPLFFELLYHILSIHVLSLLGVPLLYHTSPSSLYFDSFIYALRAHFYSCVFCCISSKSIYFIKNLAEAKSADPLKLEGSFQFQTIKLLISHEISYHYIKFSSS